MRKTVCVSGGGCLYFCGFLHLPKVLMLISWASRKQNGPSDSPLYNALPFTAVLCFLSASVRCSTVKIKVALDPDLHCSAWPPKLQVPFSPVAPDLLHGCSALACALLPSGLWH